MTNQVELQSLLDLGEQDPAVSLAFNNNCGANSSGNPGCLVANCSCTGQLAGYWSSTTLRANTVFAWNVFFKTHSVRAVRGGL